MEANSAPHSRSVQGLLMAATIWGIVFVSVAFFFKWGMPELASNRGGLDSLYYVILGITGVAYIVVQLLLGFYIWKYSDRPGAEGVYGHDSHKMEVGWTVGTAAILIPIVMIGLRLWSGVFSPPPPNAVEVEVVGAQVQWDMRYPGPDGVFGRVRPELISLANLLGVDPDDPASADDFSLTNQLVLPVDRPVGLHLRSQDMQHRFFLPQHRVKQDPEPQSFISRYVFSFDHKTIGKQYLILAMTMAVVGGLLAMLIRLQLGWPGTQWPILGSIMPTGMASGVMTPEVYVSLFTLPGTIMVFFVLSLAPVSGFGNLLIPMQIGARDMAFPFLNMLSFWTVVPGAIIIIASFFVTGGAAAAGWTAYPPLSAVQSAIPGSQMGQTLWIIGMVFFIAAFTMGGLNFVVTILNLRTKGLSMMRLPLTP